MRFPFTLLALSFAASGTLSALPRISQISPHPDISAANHHFADVDDNGFEDIIGDFPWGFWAGSPTLIRNLGNRGFAAPVPIFQIQGGELPDKNCSFIELTGPGDFQMLVNKGRSHGDFTQDSPFVIPHIVPLDQPGTFGDRTALVTEATWDWIPVDLDGDHQSEFIFVRPAPDNKTVLTIEDRQPDGTYSATTITLDATFKCDEATAIDLDDDGDLDLVLRENSEVRMLRRSGTRDFESQVRTIPLYSPGIADLDGDGLPDFHSHEAQPFDWVVNLGNFNFGTVQSQDVFPGDGYEELFLATPRPGEPAVLQFKTRTSRTLTLKSVVFGEWEAGPEQFLDFSTMNPPLVEWQSPHPLALRDLDKDGHPDLVLLVYNGIGYETYYRLAIAWGTAGGFEPPTYIHPSPISFKNLIVADFDSQDGPDFIAGPDVEGHHWFFGNDGTGNFDSPIKVGALDLPAGCPPGTEISDIKPADFNNDGIPDLAIRYLRGVTFSYQYYGQTFCAIAAGNGDGTFTMPTLPPGAFDTMVSERGGIDHVIDWDGDGDLDIIGNGEWRENINGTFSSESMPLIDGASFTDILGNPIRGIYTRVGDIDGDGHPDIVSLVYRFTDEEIEGGIIGGLGRESAIAVCFNDGHGGIEEIAEIPVTMYMTDLLGNPVILDFSIADVNGDGRADICHQQRNGTDLYGNPLRTSKWRRNPGGAAARNPALWVTLPFGSLELPDSRNPQLDFDGDGRKDWATPYGYVRPAPSGPVVSATYDFTGNAVFSPYGNTSWQVADFDGDGDTDALHTDGYLHLSLVRNPLVDERSPITRYLVTAGSTGQKAQPLSDADGDGRDNQTELLFGTDPLVKDTNPANPLGVTFVPGGDGNSLYFHLPDYADSLGLHYEIEHSTDLIDWTALEEADPDFISNSAGWDQMNLQLECSGPCGYFRIRGFHKTE